MSELLPLEALPARLIPDSGCILNKEAISNDICYQYLSNLSHFKKQTLPVFLKNACMRETSKRTIRKPKNSIKLKNIENTKKNI